MRFLTVAMVVAGLACSADQQQAHGQSSNDGARGEFDAACLRAPLVDQGRPAWDALFCMAKLSDLAYLDNPAVERQLAAWGFECQCMAAGSTTAFLGWNDDVIVLAFRGTDASKLADWIINLRSTAVALAQGGMHSGWFAAYLSLEPAILETLEKIGDKPRKLWITGHSLGGALAVACSYRMLELEKPFDATVTFGQPMAVDAKLAAYLEDAIPERYLRCVHGADLVTRLPPWSFVHFGKMTWLPSEPADVRTRAATHQAAGPMIAKGQFAPGQARLTEDEFKRLQRVLEENRDRVDEKHGTVGGTEKLRDPSGLLPKLADHGIALYVAKIRGEMLRARAAGKKPDPAE